MSRDDTARDPILDMFLFESSQLLEQLEEQLLDMERSGQLTETTINNLFRIMHTFKGNAAMMEFETITHLAHALEDLFAKLREKPATPVSWAPLTDLVLQVKDYFKLELTRIEEGQAEEAQPDNQLVRAVAELRARLEAEAQNADLSGNLTRYCAQIWFENGCEMENLRAFSAVHNLNPLVEDLSYEPDDIADNADSAVLIRENGFRIRFASSADTASLLAALEQTLFLERVELNPVVETVREADNNGNPANSGELSDAAAKSIVPASMISVPVWKLDQLLDLVGELVISEAMVVKNPELTGLQLPSFQKAARQLAKLTNELQDLAMSIRMVPITATFQKMQRIVRDMNRKLGKDVELHVAGENTEVDKSIIDHIADPLMHLIRNAVDHGIEPEPERLAAGKPARGQLLLEARSAGGDVWLTIQDDGRGLDKAGILKKATARNLLTRPAAEYSDREIFQFILLPGFSTRDEVTEFSGRGVGMDVVREKVSRIGGLINLDSNAGQGTTISIRIPLTLAIINGMQISVGDASYIIPITAIRESFRAERKQILTDPDGHEMVMLRGECLNIIRLHRRFGVTDAAEDLSSGILIVVEDDDRVFCLLADRLIGEQQVVVKPLPAYLKKSQELSGCTILGDGSISLILDIAGFSAG
jgi:two-component system chemotaxis sensor kinase CheA